MDRKLFNETLKKWLGDNCSPEEAEKLLSGLANSENEAVWLQAIEVMFRDKTVRGLSDRQSMQEALRAILKNEKQPVLAPVVSMTAAKKGRRIIWPAAAVLICIATALTAWLLSNNRKVHQVQAARNNNSLEDIGPGSNRAVLTLSNGAAIVLDTATNGLVAQQGDVTVVKQRSGRLVYTPAVSNTLSTGSNTLSTPRGGQYTLQLPDGSMVWLNSASSITYPASFLNNERNVQITGEAYFEVVKDKSKPFRVKCGDMNVEVLGTHFNINSYSNEDRTKTTLLEGRVKITVGDLANVILKPGQQAQSAHDIKVIDQVDLEQAVAWKNGFFNFNGVDLHAVMRQLERWYDIDVRYQGNIANEMFQGELTRDLNLSQVMRILEKMEVKFKLEGRTLTILQ